MNTMKNELIRWLKAEPEPGNPVARAAWKQEFNMLLSMLPGERPPQKADLALAEVKEEIMAAQCKFTPFNSPHEGYAVILEEMDELWDEVKKQPRQRDMVKLRAEARQVAAMGVRFMMDCGEGLDERD
jgi:hypothetical protein